jgi:hypothetical protein
MVDTARQRAVAAVVFDTPGGVTRFGLNPVAGAQSSLRGRGACDPWRPATGEPLESRGTMVSDVVFRGVLCRGSVGCARWPS